MVIRGEMTQPYFFQINLLFWSNPGKKKVKGYKGMCVYIYICIYDDDGDGDDDDDHDHDDGDNDDDL